MQLKAVLVKKNFHLYFYKNFFLLMYKHFQAIKKMFQEFWRSSKSIKNFFFAAYKIYKLGSISLSTNRFRNVSSFLDNVAAKVWGLDHPFKEASKPNLRLYTFAETSHCKLSLNQFETKSVKYEFTIGFRGK
jgi:hypothetical protein